MANCSLIGLNFLMSADQGFRNTAVQEADAYKPPLSINVCLRGKGRRLARCTPMSDIAGKADNICSI
jgi:hypothetical protein